MEKLHPTLWRTGRMLSGHTRLELFRRVVAHPDQTVSELAAQIHVSLPRASQELRRIQSRGLLQAVRQGLFVRYRPVPDRSVSTAGPLLQAVQEAFRRDPRNDTLIAIATAFSHARRLALIQLLLRGPWDVHELESISAMSRNTLNRQLRRLREAGLIHRIGKKIALAETDHPLARCLLELLGERPHA